MGSWTVRRRADTVMLGHWVKSGEKMLQRVQPSTAAKINLYADGADLQEFARLYADGQASGFTTNPTLMRRAGVTDYEGFAKALLECIPDRSISFEVFSDEFDEMERQALKIASWGENVFVKIPISIFAGRIADTGRDPEPLMRAAVAMAARRPLAQVLWASIREPLNVYQAAECGCHIITITPDIFKKLPMEGKDLDQLSLETVEMFRTDAVAAGFAL